MEEATVKRQFTVVVEGDPESNWLSGDVVEFPGAGQVASGTPWVIVAL